MRRIVFAVTVLGGLTTLAAAGASAAPSAAGLHAAPSNPLIIHVEDRYNHHHWHHRRWSHGHWHYWD
jgi:hypothetical protein